MEKWGQQNWREILSCSYQILILCSSGLFADHPSHLYLHMDVYLTLKLRQNKGCHLQAWPSKTSCTIFPATKGRGPQGPRKMGEAGSGNPPRGGPTPDPRTLNVAWVGNEYCIPQRCWDLGMFVAILSLPPINGEGSWKPAREWME